MTTTKKDAKNPTARKPAATKNTKADAPAKTHAAKNADASDELTVADVAREQGVDPKKPRAALRAAGMKAKDGRWPTFARGSVQHRRVLGAITGESPNAVLTQKP